MCLLPAGARGVYRHAFRLCQCFSCSHFCVQPLKGIRRDLRQLQMMPLKFPGTAKVHCLQTRAYAILQKDGKAKSGARAHNGGVTEEGKIESFMQSGMKKDDTASFIRKPAMATPLRLHPRRC